MPIFLSALGFLLGLVSTAQAASTRICVSGTTSTIMPCSNASFVDERVFVATIRAIVSYVDADGKVQSKTIDVSQTFTSPAFSGNDFNFCLPIDIPEAVTILGSSANARVEITLRYGIHGVFLFFYDGTGYGPGTLTVVTKRAGQQIVEPGLSQCYGLLPDYETNLPVPAPVPAPPPPPTPQTCYFTYQTYSPVWGNTYKFSYDEAARQCAAGGGYVPSTGDMTNDLAGLNLSGSDCYWLSNPYGSGHLGMLPGGELGVSGSCRVLCKRVGCSTPVLQSINANAVAVPGE